MYCFNSVLGSEAACLLVLERVLKKVDFRIAGFPKLAAEFSGLKLDDLRGDFKWFDTRVPERG